MRNVYGILGVDSKASDDEVRKAFHIIARRAHPDGNMDSLDAMTADPALAEEWGRAQAAYEIIKTPEKRAAYDAKLLALTPKCSRCKGTKIVQQRSGWEVKEVTCPECNGSGKQSMQVQP